MATRKAVKAPADLASKAPANATSDIDALRAEVAAEGDIYEDAVAIPFAGTTFRVLPVLDWPHSANEDQVYGRYASWASKALHPDDRAKWRRLDLPNRDVQRFMEAWETAVGMDRGE